MGGSSSKPKPIPLKELFSAIREYGMSRGKSKPFIKEKLVLTVQRIQKMADDDVKTIKGDAKKESSHDKALYRKWGMYWGKYRSDLERITGKQVNISEKLLPSHVKKQFHPGRVRREYDYFIRKDLIIYK
jgi:hypothetical protein